MTQRSMLIGEIRTVIIRAGGSVNVIGWDNDRVLVDTPDHSGLKIERRSESEFGRARAKVGDRVLFDIRLNVPDRLKKNSDEEVIEVQIGGSGQVSVPRGSHVKVYAGQGIEVEGLQGNVTLYAGSNVKTRNLHALVHASAGGTMDLECDMVIGDDLKFAAGGDIRCYIRQLTNAKFMIDDLGGYWEAVFGDGRTRIRLKCGGDVTVVTDQELVGQQPYDVMGKIERPNDAAGHN